MSGSTPTVAGMQNTIRCSGSEGRCERAVPRDVAEATVIVRAFDLDYDGHRWLVFGDRRGVDRVRCPEHRDSVL